jgi:Holliday junction resolvase-like predicted endonuclease
VNTASGISLDSAIEATVEAYLDGKPAIRGKRRLSRYERDSGFWSSEFVHFIPLWAWDSEELTLALSRYFGQERVSSFALLKRTAAACPQVVQRAVRYWSLVLQQHSPRRAEPDRIAVSNPDIAELCRVLDIFDQALRERVADVEAWTSKLAELSPFELLIYASLYAFERQISSENFLALSIPAEKLAEADERWEAINDLLIWKLTTASPAKSRLREQELERAIQRHLSPFLFPSPDGETPRHDLRTAFETLLEAQIELRSDRKAKIKKIVGWTVTSESPRGSPAMAAAVLDFWTSDWVALAARLRKGEPGLDPQLYERPIVKMGQQLIELPWIFGLQNNSAAAINNLRRLGARRGESRAETRRIEERLCALFESRGFRVALNWNPPEEMDAGIGEVDLICARDQVVLVLEVKPTFLRKSQRDAWLHKSTTLRKAGRQLRRKVPAVECALAEGSDLGCRNPPQIRAKNFPLFGFDRQQKRPGASCAWYREYASVPKSPDRLDGRARGRLKGLLRPDDRRARGSTTQCDSCLPAGCARGYA